MTFSRGARSVYRRVISSPSKWCGEGPGLTVDDFRQNLYRQLIHGEGSRALRAVSGGKVSHRDIGLLLEILDSFPVGFPPQSALQTRPSRGFNSHGTNDWTRCRIDRSTCTYENGLSYTE